MAAPFRQSLKMTACARLSLALDCVSGSQPLSSLATAHSVSRQTVHSIATRARTAVAAAFTPVSGDDEKAVFQLSVTKGWLRQMIVALVLICRGSYSGVMEFARDLLGIRLSAGHIHDVIKQAAGEAALVNGREDLSGIDVGLHDELFHGNNPILVGVDAASTYCYLLSVEDHRDADTWAIHLMDLRKQGLEPIYTVADAGQGLRAGQRLAWDGQKPCHGDVFHILQQIEELIGIRDRIAKGDRKRLDKFESSLESGDDDEELLEQWMLATQTAATSAALTRDLRILTEWMRRDVLASAGAGLDNRRPLFDFIAGEFVQRQPCDEKRIRPVCVALKNQREQLLAFVGIIDGKLADIAQRHKISEALVRQVCLLQRLHDIASPYWQRAQQLRTILREKFDAVLADVTQALAQTPRCSSMVENLNSRLRTYVTLRREIGGDYLGLLRFFFNHRRFIRSRRPERVGKSPCEMMTGQPHPHWLTMLGLGPIHQKIA
jgi:hypothetical protein